MLLLRTGIIYTVAAVISVTVLASMSVFYWRKNTSGYDFKCQAFIAYKTIPPIFKYDASISVSLMNDGRGKFSIEGKINKGEEFWTINRDVHFMYVKRPDNSVQIKNVDIDRYGRDDVPDVLFRDAFLSSNEESGRVVTISKMMNGYLIGSHRAPVFFCVSSKGPSDEAVF